MECLKKRYAIALVSISLFSCQKEEVKPVPVEDCGCDRIVNVVRAKYSFPGQPNTYWATITTVNDCSNWQKQYEYESNYSIYSKKVGECY